MLGWWITYPRALRRRVVRGSLTPLVQEAARLVALWEDLQSVEPHELRGHLVLARMCDAFAQAIHEVEWHVTAPFTVPVTQQELGVTVLVRNANDGPPATMREGHPSDLERHYPIGTLRAHLAAGDTGILASWRPWVNVYFWNAIRDALFGLPTNGSERVGAAWRQAAQRPDANAVHLAWRTLADRRFATRHDPHATLRADFALAEMPAWIRDDGELVSRVEVVWRVAERLPVKIPPQNIPLDVLRTRHPPAGQRRKGRSLTVGQFVAWYLVRELRMDVDEAATHLGMEADWRQVRDAVAEGDRKKAAWAG
jgi:hypothetical protein